MVQTGSSFFDMGKGAEASGDEVRSWRREISEHSI